MKMPIYVVFDGPPGPDCRFVDVEDQQGRNVDVGEWVRTDSGHWALKFIVDASEEPVISSGTA